MPASKLHMIPTMDPRSVLWLEKNYALPTTKSASTPTLPSKYSPQKAIHRSLKDHVPHSMQTLIPMSTSVRWVSRMDPPSHTILFTSPMIIAMNRHATQSLSESKPALCAVLEAEAIPPSPAILYRCLSQASTMARQGVKYSSNLYWLPRP